MPRFAMLVLVLFLVTTLSPSCALNARLWRPTGNEDGSSYTYTFPEMGSTRGTGLGVTFSGGGTRAFVCGIGQMRGLNMLGLQDAIEYQVGISGGGWFTSAYLYDQRNYTDEERLCPYVGPESLNQSFLEEMPDACMGKAAQSNIYVENLKYLSKARSSNELRMDQVWTYAIHACYHAPFDIPIDAGIARNTSHLNDILARNPSLSASDFILPKDEAGPFMILGGSILDPIDHNPLEYGDFPWIEMDMTPLYSGLPQEKTVSFTNRWRQQEVAHYGGYIESFAFGGNPAGDVSGEWENGLENSLSIDRYDGLFGVTDIASISSMAIGGALNQLGPSNALTINATLFNVSDPEDSSLQMILADGGIVENNGVIAMLRRRVPKFVMFYNAMRSLANSSIWDPSTTTPSSDYIDDYLPALFGIQCTDEPSRNPTYWPWNDQVFETEQFAPFMADLQAAQSTGKGTIASAKLTTVENKLMGIAGGLEVEVLLMYLDLPSKWLSQLPQSLQDDIAKGKKGSYPDFPDYGTLDPRTVDLTPAQTNLLSNLMTWTVLENADTFTSFMSA